MTKKILAPRTKLPPAIDKVWDSWPSVVLRAVFKSFYYFPLSILFLSPIEKKDFKIKKQV
jgi:hypothetical protein